MSGVLNEGSAISLVLWDGLSSDADGAAKADADLDRLHVAFDEAGEGMLSAVSTVSRNAASVMVLDDTGSGAALPSVVVFGLGGFLALSPPLAVAEVATDRPRDELILGVVLPNFGCTPAAKTAVAAAAWPCTVCSFFAAVAAPAALTAAAATAASILWRAFAFALATSAAAFAAAPVGADGGGGVSAMDTTVFFSG